MYRYNNSNFVEYNYTHYCTFVFNQFNSLNCVTDTKLELNNKHCFQSEAKKYRTGIKYTHLKLISGGEFKRPKVWSKPQMVVYEFEMQERFLENQEYFDHYPSKYLIMAQVHCLVMFAMKIILCAVQKTTITFEYVNTVI